MKIKHIMSERVLTLHPKEKINIAYELCNLHKIHHLPITVHKKVVGMISIGDLVKAIIHDQKILIDQLQNYISG